MSKAFGLFLNNRPELRNKWTAATSFQLEHRRQSGRVPTFELLKKKLKSTRTLFRSTPLDLNSKDYFCTRVTNFPYRSSISRITISRCMPLSIWVRTSVCSTIVKRRDTGAKIAALRIGSWLCLSTRLVTKLISTKCPGLTSL